MIAVAATGPRDDAQPVNALGHVTVGAPGVDLVGLGLDGGFVEAQSGTPPAAAAVAATVTDLRARFPGLTPAEIRDRLISTADRPGTAVPDPGLGWGVLNPVSALSAPLPVAGPVASTAPVPMTVVLPPEPTGNDWAITIAAIALALAAAIAAAGARRANARRWRPAGPERLRDITLVAESPMEFAGDSFANPDEIADPPFPNSERVQQLDPGTGNARTDEPAGSAEQSRFRWADSPSWDFHRYEL